MKGNAARFVQLGAGLLGLVTLGWVLTGQAAKPVVAGLPTDWTHRHLIYSQPTTAERAQAAMSDPRFWQQWNRNHTARAVLADPASLFAAPGKVHRDWSQNLGNLSTPGAAAGVYPAKYSFSVTTANCGNVATPDYVVFSTVLVGSGTQANIAAYDNLYSGCTGIVPSVYWAYNTGGTVLTSPVFSKDGSQVAFVESNGGVGILVLLKWAAGTGTVGSPAAPTNVPAVSYAACVAPCMTQIILRDGSNLITDDTTSSVFYDYTNDVAWVGGARGWLHKISPVFSGMPGEVHAGGFPVQVFPSQPNSLSDVVFDHVSGNIFVGDFGGYFYRVNASTGVVTRSGQLDFGTGLVTGPIVDAGAGKAYVFASSDGTTACVGATPCTAVYQFGASFGAGTTGSKAVVGASSAVSPNPLHEGDFDSAYQATHATGNLYVCGNTGGPPILYQVPITAGVMGTVLAGPVLANTTTPCSPVTDVPNPNATGGAAEWIFASAQAGGTGNSCASGGCIMNFKARPWTPSTAYAVGQEVLDTHFQVQVVRVAGTSRATTPVWSTVVGNSTTDNTVRWLNQGPQTPSHATWVASHAYALGAEIVDINNNIQLVTTAGTSKAGTHPVWNTVPNGATADNTVRWRNVGSIATASLAAAGGTSGIITDNVVGSGILAGASQVYFSTLNNQNCGSTGTGGCAVQASQSALQ